MLCLRNRKRLAQWCLVQEKHHPGLILLLPSFANSVIEYVEFKISQAETRLKQIIRNRTHEAYDIAINLYNQHRATRSPAEIKKIIKDALRPIRYNKQRGYYFVTRLDGVEILFADRPEMEGLN